MPKLPLVSCVMPTGARPHLLEQALRCFEAQTYPHRELILVDDGSAPKGGLPAQVRRLAVAPSTLTGTKMNLGLAVAEGRVFQKLDDDDYYAPSFLETAVSALLSSPKDVIVAWDGFLVMFAGSRELRFSGHQRRAGGSLCFRREVWEQHPFREAPNRIDTLFLKDADRPIVRICAPELYVVLRHGANTWNTRRNGGSVDAMLRRRNLYVKRLEDVVGEEAAAFYSALPPVEDSEPNPAT